MDTWTLLALLLLSPLAVCAKTSADPGQGRLVSGMMDACTECYLRSLTREPRLPEPAQYYQARMARATGRERSIPCLFNPVSCVNNPYTIRRQHAAAG